MKHTVTLSGCPGSVRKTYSTSSPQPPSHPRELSAGGAAATDDWKTRVGTDGTGTQSCAPGSRARPADVCPVCPDRIRWSCRSTDNPGAVDP